MDESFYNLFVKAQSLDDRKKYLLLDGLKDMIFSEFDIEPVEDEEIIEAEIKKASRKKISKKK